MQIKKAGLSIFVGLIFVSGVFAGITKRPFVNIPSTVSSEAQKLLGTFTDPRNRPASPGVNDVGGYTLYSARSMFNIASLTAQATGYRVLSIDYTRAPQAKWEQISDEIISVFKALLDQGYKMENIAIFGDSAGGGLASTSTLRLRDEEFGMPAAVVLYSPMADVSTPGDSYSTLADAEPMYLLDLHIRSAFDSYANPTDQKNPYVSSVYGDYSRGYPPTLIQVGIKELILSGPVRLYQAMDTAGVDVKLDVYEGMPHVFQAIPGIPDSKLALGKVNVFLKEHLGEYTQAPALFLSLSSDIIHLTKESGFSV